MDLQNTSYKNISMIKFTNSFTQFSIHATFDHYLVTWRTSPLNFITIKISLYINRISWSIQFVQKPIFRFIVANRTNLSRISGNYTLINNSIKHNHVLELVFSLL